MSDESNPFVRYGLDPAMTLAELTERMRELAEEASEEERVALRAAWDALTRSPARRLELVLMAGPAPRAIDLGPTSAPPAAWPEPTLADLLAPPPLGPALAPETDAERRARKIDLSSLVRDDEAEITGALRPRGAR